MQNLLQIARAFRHGGSGGRGPSAVPGRAICAGLDGRKNFLEVKSIAKIATKMSVRYFTGVPCANGHTAERLVSGDCVECRREYRRRDRAKKNPAYVPLAERSAALAERREQQAIARAQREAAANAARAEREEKALVLKTWRDNRQNALAAGLTRYEGRPCQHGHGVVRVAADGGCVVCNRENKRGRKTRGRKESRAAQKKRYAAKYPEKLRARKRRQAQRRKLKVILGLALPKKRIRRSAARAAQRKERKLLQAQRVPPWAKTPEQRKAIASIYTQMRIATDLTGIPHEVDHVYPLRGRTVSGLHVAENLRVVPAVVNLRKSNRHPDEVAQCH